SCISLACPSSCSFINCCSCAFSLCRALSRCAAICCACLWASARSTSRTACNAPSVDCSSCSSACLAKPSCRLNLEAHFGQVTRVSSGKNNCWVTSDSFDTSVALHEEFRLWVPDHDPICTRGADRCQQDERFAEIHSCEEYGANHHAHDRKDHPAREAERSGCGLRPAQHRDRGTHCSVKEQP